MRLSQTIATWLFKGLDLDVALTGDLVEECARGRSVIWYWWQVSIAIATHIWVGLRDHKALALRAVATGCAMEFLFMSLWNRWGPELPMFSITQWITQLSVTLLTQAATGWVIARTHRAHQIPMVLLFLICFLLWYGYGVFSWTRMLLHYSVDGPAFRSRIAIFCITGLMATMGILLGGIFARRERTC